MNTYYGIIIRTYSNKNNIHQNNFIENNHYGKQAYDETSGSNFWNSTYPSGGNYWSDWTTPDIKNGPDQNLSGGDGIVDVPYLIDGGAKDFYPLTTKVYVVPEYSTHPLIMLSVILLVAIVAGLRRRN
jgi:nitrous oxidase accessory protein NosD